LTPWSNDPVLDPAGELCYLRDEESGEYWTVAPSRGEISADPCYISHGHGYTRFRRQVHGLLQEMTVFVPLDAPVKVIELRIANKTRERRKLSVTYYADWVLGVKRENRSLIVTEWDEESRSLLARNAYQETFRDATAFLTICPQADPSAEAPDSQRTEPASGTDAAEDATSANDVSADDPPSADITWTTDRLEFIGRNGTAEKPQALRRSKLSGKTGPHHDACGAVQAKLTIEPGGERTVIVLLGCERSRESAIRLARRFGDPAVCRQALADVCDFWDGVLGQITVSTPSPETNALLNRWLLYQTLACRMWARTGFYQAGGAYGFRDQLQDALAMLHSRPDITRAQIVFHAAHQYEEGDVQHWWHMEMARGIRSRYTDDLLWLPYAVARYVEHTGDDSLLDETVPFLYSESLRDEEHERYEPTVVAKKSGTVYEHCVRAIERSLRFGEHGLPLIGGGDWNDGLNRVGDAGRGESVWLGWFLGDVLRRFAELCERRGDIERASRYRAARNNLAASLDEHAWDGQWYRRAFTDDGQWLGSVRSAECRIDAIAQSWSVISGMADKDKAAQAMRSFDRELVDRDLNVSLLLAPPFDRTEPSPGYIQGYPPGIRENGGQYTHGAIWSIIAWCQMGEGDKAFELFNMINPVTHTRSPGETRRYAGEPYVMAADVYSAGPRKGHAGWTWYTGSAGWMYQAGIEWILGLRRRGQRLHIKPCIPREWPEFSVTYRYGGARYRITVQNAAPGAGGKPGLIVDGREAAYAADAENGPYVELRDDGRDHQVVLTL
jgi:cellobiose phosphorylase